MGLTSTQTRTDLLQREVKRLVQSGQTPTAELVNKSLPADVVKATPEELVGLVAKQNDGVAQSTNVFRNAISSIRTALGFGGGNAKSSPAYSRPTFEASKTGVKADVAAVQAPVVDRTQAIADVAKFVASTLKQNPSSRVTEEQAVTRWGAKADDALAFWKEPKAQSYFRSCISYLNADPGGNWPDRTFQQVADIALWTDIMTQNGTLKARPTGDWMKAVEMAVVGIELGPNSDIGHAEEHWRAGQNAGRNAQYAFGDAALGDMVQSLIACSSAKGLKIEMARKDPAYARAEVKRMTWGKEPAFLKDDAGVHAFLEALFLVKLSDMSRGSHGTTKETLGASRMATSGLVSAFRAANAAADAPAADVPAADPAPASP